MTENAPTAMGGLQHVATFCGQCSCGCPELWVDPVGMREITYEESRQRRKAMVPSQGEPCRRDEAMSLDAPGWQAEDDPGPDMR